MKNFCKAKEAMTKRKRAFTLVEVLIVVVIIGILFVTLMVNLGFSTDKANMAGVQNDFHAFQTAIQIVAMEEQGLNVPIESLKLSINKKLDTGLKLSVIEGGSMYSSGVDPWGTEYRLDYSQPANTNGQIILVSAGPDNKYDTADDIKSTIRYDTSDGNKVVVDGEILEQDTSIFNTELTFKPEINNTEFDNAFNTCTNSSTSSMLAVGPTSFTTYTLIEGTNYSITGSKDSVTGIRVVKYVANGTSYWHLNQEAAAYVGQPESGWYTVNGATYTKYDTQLSVTIANGDNISALNHEGLKYLFNGVHEHDYSSKVLSPDYVKTPGTCVDKAVYYFACTCGRMSTTTFEGEKDASNHPAGDENYQHEYIQKTAENHIHKSTCLQCHNIVVEEDQKHDFGGTLLCKQCNAIKHTHNYSRQLTDSKYLKSVATCTSPAIYYYACDGCEAYDETKTFTNGSALGHDGAAATCTTAAVCTRCKNTYQAALGHSFTRQDARTDLQVSPATCTQPAVYYYLCVRCDEVSTTTWSDAGSVLGHAFNKQNTDSKYLAVAATCVTPAKYYFSCKCGDFDSTGAMFESGTANGSHIGGTRIEYEQIEDDYSYHTKETVCETCSMVLEAEQESHVTQDNLFCYLCDFEIHVCNYNTKRVEDAYLSFPATCTTTAVYYFACEEPNCTKHGVATYPHGAALEHTYTSSITTDPTCTVDGVRTYTCTRYWTNPVNGARINCEHEYTDSVPALGHEFTGELTTQQYLARPATCMDPAAYYFCCEREGCGAASGSTFVAGEVNPNAHFGEVIAVGTAAICSKYSCCGGGEITQHTYLLDASRYYWGGYEDDNTDATGSANCSEFWMEAVCGCGYVNIIGRTITTVAQTAATCTSDGNAKYHYVRFTINGVSTTFTCDEHNTPLNSETSDYAAYRNAYSNTYHKLPTALGHSFSTNPTHASVSYEFKNSCKQATLTRICTRSGCSETSTQTVNTAKIVQVQRACGVAEQYIYQATFSVLQSGSQKINCTAKNCSGHTGTTSTHIGTIVSGANGVAGTGTAAVHGSCSSCGASRQSGSSHSFTVDTLVQSTNHSTSSTLGSNIYLEYKVSCSCGYSYTSGKVYATKGSVSQSKTYCTDTEKSYYSYTITPDTGNSSANTKVKTAVQNAWKEKTGRTDMRCCSGSHVSQAAGTCNSSGTSTWGSCSYSQSGSYYNITCTKCGKVRTQYTWVSCSAYYVTSGNCKTYKQMYYQHKFKDSSGNYYYKTCSCSGSHTSSSYGSHSWGSTQYQYACPKATYYSHGYQICSLCNSRRTTVYADDMNSSFIYVYGEGDGSNCWYYKPKTSSSEPGALKYVGNWSSANGAKFYYFGNDTMGVGCGGTSNDARAKAQIRYQVGTSGTQTVVKTGSASAGPEYTLTIKPNQTYVIYYEKNTDSSGVLGIGATYYWICYIKENVYNTNMLDDVHNHSWYTGCTCSGGVNPYDY